MTALDHYYQHLYNTIDLDHGKRSRKIQERRSKIAIEADGSILIADANAFGGGGGVIRVDPATGAQTTVPSGGDFVAPVGIAVEADGGILIVDSDAFGGPGGLIRVDPVSGAQTRLSSGGSFQSPRRIAIVRWPAAVS